MVKVLGLSNDLHGCQTQVRLVTPLNAWKKRYHGALQLYDLVSCPDEAISWADVVYIQKHLSIATLNIIKKARQRNKIVIYDIDDYLLDLPSHLLHHQAGLAAYPDLLRFLAPQIDCITVSTVNLQHYMQIYNRPTMLLPNTIVADDVLPPASQDWIPDKATLLISASDQIDLRLIVVAVSKLLALEAFDLDVVVIGPIAKAFEEAGVKVTVLPLLSYNDFKSKIQTISNPIAVIPLDSSTFSSCKSAIKYFDYSAAGIPVVCSDVLPYADVIESGVNGLLVDNHASTFVTGISALIKDVPLRVQLVNNAQNTLLRHHTTYSSAKVLNDLFAKAQNNSFALPKAVKSSAWLYFWYKFIYYFRHSVSLGSYLRLVQIMKDKGFRFLISRFGL